MTFKTQLIILLVAVFSSFLASWGIQTNRYEAKLLKQEIAFRDAQKILQENHLETLKYQQGISNTETQKYKDEVLKLHEQIKEAEVLNLEHTSVIDGLRKQQDYLRTRIRTVSDEAVREYAAGASTALTEISEALRDEQLAHQETSRKADEYYSAWRALDRSWPEAE